jgi:hypothetical protein
MVTFPTWPVPILGRVTFAAACPCGLDAVWEQTGLGGSELVYTIRCSCDQALPVPLAS